MTLQPYTVTLTLDGKEGDPFVIQSTPSLEREGARQILADSLNGRAEGSIAIARGDDPDNLEWLGVWDYENGSFTWQPDS
jgi:hypothetical protein